MKRRGFKSHHPDSQSGGVRNALQTTTRWYSPEPTDASFFDSAPHIFRYDMRYAAAPHRVWESLASDASVSVWGPSVKIVTWLSSRPFGVGTTREVVLLGNLRVHEYFIRWDKGHGILAVYEASVPVFRRAAENYEVAPDGEGAVIHVDGCARTDKRTLTAVHGVRPVTQARLRAHRQRRRTLLRQARLALR